MIPAFLAFGVTLCALLGVYWLFVLKPEQQTADVLHRRLKSTPATKRSAAGATILRDTKELSSLAALDGLLHRVLGLSRPLSDLIEHSGVKLTVGTLVLASGCLGLAGFLFGSLVLRFTIAGLILAPICAAAPFVFLQWKRKRRILQFEEQFPEALDLLARSLRAGHALTTGIALVAEEMPAPVGPEFRLLYDRQNFGMPFPDALRDFGERIPVLDAKFFTTAVLIQRESGGNLSEVLGNLSSVIRERFRVKRQVRVLSAHGRITGWVLSGLPPALAAAFMISSEEHMQTLITDPLGRQMIVVAVCLQIIGTLIIRKLVQIEYLRRKMDISLILALVGVFACVALLTATVASLAFERQSAGNRRFREVMKSVTSRTASQAAMVIETAGPSPFVQKLSKILPKSPKDMGRLQRRLATAGLHGAVPMATYLIAEVALAFVAFLLPLYFVGWRKGMLFAVLAAIVGYMIPSFTVSYYVAKRKKQIGNGLPDALDLLIVCLEAGLGLDQAISKCAEELTLAYPALAEEMRMINVEGRAGKPRIEAFKNFAERTKVDDVRALVSMLIQTDRFGTSVAQALRTHADVSRTKRRQRAEEKAAKVGVKLVFPLVFCLFPAFYVVTLGPAIIKFVHALAPGGALSGGN